MRPWPTPSPPSPTQPTSPSTPNSHGGGSGEGPSVLGEPDFWKCYGRTLNVKHVYFVCDGTVLERPWDDPLVIARKYAEERDRVRMTGYAEKRRLAARVME